MRDIRYIPVYRGCRDRVAITQSNGFARKSIPCSLQLGLNGRREPSVSWVAGGEWPLVCLVYAQKPLDILAGGLAFWSKMDILGLWVHSSELVLQHIVELEESVGLV